MEVALCSIAAQQPQQLALFGRLDPSATVNRPNADAKPMMVRVSVMLVWSPGRPLTKLRSILSRSTGSLDSNPKDE